MENDESSSFKFLMVFKGGKLRFSEKGKVCSSRVLKNSFFKPRHVFENKVKGKKMVGIGSNLFLFFFLSSVETGWEINFLKEYGINRREREKEESTYFSSRKWIRSKEGEIWSDVCDLHSRDFRKCCYFHCWEISMGSRVNGGKSVARRKGNFCIHRNNAFTFTSLKKKSVYRWIRD